ncbi:Lipid A core - O-antigen ligase and related enzymes [Mycolicibacterium aurum]|uniref:Lipid A core - O-antigen ligase and related enzymes n=1 Tax=Mycolicibacterium aurum TaxID=1791 RepID=A0A448IIN9_MYCAU|nr:O-antigen ligase family protein [Mycolicibacterium aurum]VEG52326.1 Lipid A core - O-antigen ligase and related enzymes [Mycolicibacterium aurum]
MDAKPAAQVRPKKRWPASLWLFIGALGLLQLSQILQFPPGSDVSPFTIQTVGLWPNTLAGITVITWAFIILTAVSLPGAISRTNDSVEGGLAIWFALVTLSLISLLTTSSANNLVDGVGALAIPVIAYMFLVARIRDAGSDIGTKIIFWVNIFTVGQVGVAYFITGSFGPNRYYRELDQEFFGLFYHPFAFAGILGICTVVAFRHVLGRRQIALNATLVALNVGFIVLSDVRTYILATAVGLAISVLVLTIRRRHLALALAIPSLVIAAAVIGAGDLILSGERVTGAFDSGRFARWQLDLETVWEEAGIVQLYFGGGPQYILELNQSLFGSNINSLNLAIDLLVDFGIVGSILYIFIWILIIRDAARFGDAQVVWPLVGFVVVATMISNIIAFPAVAVLFAVALTSCCQSSSRESNAHSGASSTAVPRGSGEQRMVGRGIH